MDKKIKELMIRLAPIIKENEEKQAKRMETGFNLFYLISDHYYRETFHSDIIAALLSLNTSVRLNFSER